MEFSGDYLSEIAKKEISESVQADISEHITGVEEAKNGLEQGVLSEPEQIERISGFIDGLDEIKLENWEKLALEERVDVLQRIENQTAEITGRTPLKVEVMRAGPGERGEMDWGDQKIRINRSLVVSNNMSDLRQTVTTLAHEGRHAYQWSNLYEKRTETSNEKFDSWRVNIQETGYVSAYKMGYKWYYTQPVEVDARVFAEGVANKIGLR